MSIPRGEAFVEKLFEKLPSALKTLPKDIQDTMKEHFESTLNRLDIVTREEFDAQKAVLERTREKLEALERQIEQLDHREDT